MRMMRESGQTEYGLAHNFKCIRTLDDFKHYIPLTSYTDYTDYIERIAAGKRNILTAYLTEHISIWDGFRGLPQSRWGVQASYAYSFCSGFYIAGKHGFLTNGMTLNLVDNSVERLASGVTMGNLLGRLLVKREFENKQVYVVRSTSRNRNMKIRFSICRHSMPSRKRTYHWPSATAMTTWSRCFAILRNTGVAYGNDRARQQLYTARHGASQ